MLLSCHWMSVYSIVYHVPVEPVCLKVNGSSLQNEEVTAFDSDEDEAKTAAATNYLKKNPPVLFLLLLLLPLF